MPDFARTSTPRCTTTICYSLPPYTFGQLTPQQVQPTVDTNGNVTGLRSYNTAQGRQSQLFVVIQ